MVLVIPGKSNTTNGLRKRDCRLLINAFKEFHHVRVKLQPVKTFKRLHLLVYSGMSVAPFLNGRMVCQAIH